MSGLKRGVASCVVLLIATAIFGCLVIAR